MKQHPIKAERAYADVAAAYGLSHTNAKALVQTALYGDPAACLLMEAARITAAGARGEL